MLHLEEAKCPFAMFDLEGRKRSGQVQCIGRPKEYVDRRPNIIPGSESILYCNCLLFFSLPKSNSLDEDIIGLVREPCSPSISQDCHHMPVPWRPACMLQGIIRGFAPHGDARLDQTRNQIASAVLHSILILY